jgi:late competence protein required for DNA uptake (superfamily II DNA/RNA helicase)
MKVRCTKCGVNEVNSEFIVDRDTGYCRECATLLRLGTSREAIKMEQGIPRTHQDDDKEPAEEVSETL